MQLMYSVLPKRLDLIKSLQQAIPFDLEVGGALNL